jgi:hypothetical protein
MLVGKIKNHRNVYRNLIISYLLILLIPFCIGSFVYLEAVKLVKEDALKNNEKILTQTIDILDIRLNEVEAISKQLAMSPKVNSLINMKQFREGTPDYYKVWDLLNTMPKYNLTNQFINDIYLVYKNTKLVVSLNTPYSSSTSFYKQIFSGSFNSYGEFWSMLWEKSYQREYVVMNDNDIYSFQTIPIDAVNNLRGVIMVSISGRSITDMLSKVDIGNHGIVFIYDNKGQIIAEIRGKDAKVT